MGHIRIQPPVKLIVGFIFKEDVILNEALDLLQEKFKAIDFESETLKFNQTDYYKKELGDNLSRKFISFKKLILPQYLAKIKIYTNNIERRLSCGSKRSINIDPGYLDLAKLILPTTKDFAHRIYLNNGIYAETTLYFKDGTFQAYDWTYPDYRTEEYIRIFNQIRNIYSKQKE